MAVKQSSKNVKSVKSTKSVKKNPVASKDLAVKDQDTSLQLFVTDAPTGFEKTTPDSFKTPFLKILQELSPEMKKSDPAYNPDAECGDFCNTATGKLYKSINIVVVKVDHALIVWQPKRGGYVGRYDKTEENEVVKSREGFNKYDAEGNDVMDTIELYCIDIDDPTSAFIFPLSSTAFKYAKQFTTRMRMLCVGKEPVGVSWAGVWNISTAEERRDQDSWFTIGTTPMFQRFITKEERDNVIFPAIKQLQVADVDYNGQTVVDENDNDTKEDNNTPF